MGRMDSGGGLIVLVVSGNWLKVFGLENLVAIETTHIVDPVAPCQNLGTRVLADLHRRKRDYPHSKHPDSLVKPP